MKKNKLLIISSLICLSLIGCSKSNIIQTSINTSNSISSNISSNNSSTLISKQDLNIKFENKTVEYNGNYHTIEVVGAPINATITYNGDHEFVNVGTYNIFVTVSAPGYNSKTLGATLIIKKATFKGVTLTSQTFKYDGKSHRIEVEGAPSFARVSYKTKNNAINAGSYTVSAEVLADNYETLKLTATLTITKLDITGISFTNLEVPYDGKSHSLEVEGNIPTGVSVTYTSNVAGITNSASEPGEYVVTATLTSTNYNTLSLTATLKIYEEVVSYVYEDKTPSRISSNIKVNELKELFKINNFSTYITFQYVEDHPSGTEVLSTSNYAFYFDKNKACYLDLSCLDGQYNNDYYYFDNSYSYHIEAPALKKGNAFADPAYVYYAPKDSFMETYIVKRSMKPFHRLGEDENGYFTNLDTDGYHTVHSTFEIKNNRFILTETVYYFHSDTDPRREITTYEYYNFGNTKVSLPSKYNVDVSKLTLDNLEYTFYMVGIGYNYDSRYDTFVATIDLDNNLIHYIPKGTYYVLPELYGKKVDKVTANKPYYEKVDTTGYNYRFFFSDDTYQYQDKYTSLGTVNYRWSEVSRYFETYGGTVEFYEDWNK